jgi:ubiquinone/menaquinone biosynthesis C-methylase UbiE
MTNSRINVNQHPRRVVDVYDSARLASCYAFDRPPVHQRILASVLERAAYARALDVGCGAGRSTAALAPYARFVSAVEPAEAMLAHRRDVAPSGQFVVGTAERLPYATGSFDLVTAAGSLNYADLGLALAEVSRVLSRAGTFVIYDFSEGRHARDTAALADWFGRFERRFPWPPGYRPLAVPTLAFADFDLIWLVTRRWRSRSNCLRRHMRVIC